MRKIYLLEFMSLDGVIQAPGGSKEDAAEGFKYGGWMGTFFDDAGGREMDRQMSQTAALLLGRKTYDIFAGYWPTHTETWSQVNAIPKYVVSTTLTNPKWEHTTVLPDMDALKTLKNSDGPDMQVYGSSNLVQSLMREDLVDEYWLKIFPVTLGSGKRLFDKGTQPRSFELIESQITPSGIFIGRYRRAGKIRIQPVVS